METKNQNFSKIKHTEANKVNAFEYMFRKLNVFYVAFIFAIEQKQERNSE